MPITWRSSFVAAAPSSVAARCSSRCSTEGPSCSSTCLLPCAIMLMTSLRKSVVCSLVSCWPCLADLAAGSSVPPGPLAAAGRFDIFHARLDDLAPPLLRSFTASLLLGHVAPRFHEPASRAGRISHHALISFSAVGLLSSPSCLILRQHSTFDSTPGLLDLITVFWGLVSLHRVISWFALLCRLLTNEPALGLGKIAICFLIFVL